MTRVWCVRRLSGIWCATFRGHPPSIDINDWTHTACGFHLSDRSGIAQRQPTCEACKLRVSRRRR